MRQQPITDDSWTEAEAMRLVRGLSPGQSRTTRRDPAAGADAAEEKTCRDLLTRTVEDEVIPRLLLARRPQQIAGASAASALPPAAIVPDAERVAKLTALVLHGAQSDSTAFVEAIRDTGQTADALMLDLLAPTARELGRMWEEDTADFAEVTIGLVRLGNVMRLLSRGFAGDGAETRRPGTSVLLAQMPGEQHGFGLEMVVQFFRRAGWQVRQEQNLTSAELIDIARREWFGLVGISLSCNERLEALATDIRAIRRHSRNPAIGVMVGGPPFIAHPQLAAMVGADATAVDARQAVQQAHCLLSLLAGPAVTSQG